MEQIWPKECGKSTSIGKYLRCMLLSNKIQEWDEAYNQAIKVLEGDPNSDSIVMAFHQNPSYYAGYYLKGIEGDMDVIGSVTAE